MVTNVAQELGFNGQKEMKENEGLYIIISCYKPVNNEENGELFARVLTWLLFEIIEKL